MKKIISICILISLVMSFFCVSGFAADVGEETIAENVTTIEEETDNTENKAEENEYYEYEENPGYSERVKRVADKASEMLFEGVVTLPGGLGASLLTLIPVVGLPFGLIGLISALISVGLIFAGIGEYALSPVIGIFTDGYN